MAKIRQAKLAAERVSTEETDGERADGGCQACTEEPTARSLPVSLQRAARSPRSRDRKS
jgi:hypothetical protein